MHSKKTKQVADPSTGVGQVPEFAATKVGIPEAVVGARVAAAALAMSGTRASTESQVERARYLRALVEAENPQTEEMLQLILMKEVTSGKFMELLIRSSGHNLSIEQQTKGAELAIKFGKLYAQLQSEHEKAKRQGIQRFIVQNNGPVSGQSFFGDVTPDKEPPIMTISSPSAPRAKRKANDV